MKALRNPPLRAISKLDLPNWRNVMPILRAECPSCGASLKIANLSLAGKVVKCPKWRSNPNFKFAGSG